MNYSVDFNKKMAMIKKIHINHKKLRGDDLSTFSFQKKYIIKYRFIVHFQKKEKGVDSLPVGRIKFELLVNTVRK